MKAFEIKTTEGFSFIWTIWDRNAVDVSELGYLDDDSRFIWTIWDRNEITLYLAFVFSDSFIWTIWDRNRVRKNDYQWEKAMGFIWTIWDRNLWDKYHRDIFQSVLSELYGIEICFVEGTPNHHIWFWFYLNYMG